MWCSYAHFQIASGVFEATKRDGVVSVDEHRLNQLAEQLDISEVQLIRLREDSQQDERKKVHLRAEHQSLLERITSSGGGGGDIATVKELVEEREQNRNKLRESHRTMEDIYPAVYLSIWSQRN